MLLQIPVKDFRVGDRVGFRSYEKKDPPDFDLKFSKVTELPKPQLGVGGDPSGSMWVRFEDYGMQSIRADHVFPVER